MKVFMRVAEMGSFSAVAQQMGVAPSLVTRQVAALEAHLATKLIARSTRSLTLTSAGTTYLEKCRVILNLVEAAETDIADEHQAPRGQVRISLPLSYGIKRVAPILLQLAQRYPELSLDMDHSDRRVNLIEEGFDFSVRVTRQLGSNEVARRLGTVRMLVLGAPDYLARHGVPRHPSELAHHECLGYTFSGASMAWPFMVDGQLQQVNVRSRIHGNNGEVLCAAAAQGLGIACQPDFIAEDFLRRGAVEQILHDYPVPELGVYAMLPGNRHIPHRVRVLLDALQVALAAPVTTG